MRQLLVISSFVLLASSTPTQYTEAIENILEKAGDKSMVQINKEIDAVVKKMDEKTQKDHEEWKKRIELEEKERMNRIKQVLPTLSIPTQQKLVRIIMVQQNKRMTPSEKQRTLHHIMRNIDPSMRKEMTEKLTENDLFSLVL